MAVGKKIVSAYAGPADDKSFNRITHKLSTGDNKNSRSQSNSELNSLYLAVRNYREGKNTQHTPEVVFEILKKDYPNDWLLTVELYEIAFKRQKTAFLGEILAYLEELKQIKRSIAHLIIDGVDLINADKLIEKV